MIAVDRHFLEIGVPGFARVQAELLSRLAGQQIPGALHVLGGKRLAVMPLHAPPQRKCQFGRVLAPRPARRQIGHDRLRAVLRHVLPVHDQIIEDAHHRAVDRGGRFLVHRHARRAVEMRHAQDPAGLLRQCGYADGPEGEQTARNDRTVVKAARGRFIAVYLLRFLS